MHPLEGPSCTRAASYVQAPKGPLMGHYDVTPAHSQSALGFDIKGISHTATTVHFHIYSMSNTLTFLDPICVSAYEIQTYLISFWLARFSFKF